MWNAHRSRPYRISCFNCNWRFHIHVRLSRSHSKYSPEWKWIRIRCNARAFYVSPIKLIRWLPRTLHGIPIQIWVSNKIWIWIHYLRQRWCQPRRTISLRDSPLASIDRTRDGLCTISPSRVCHFPNRIYIWVEHYRLDERPTVPLHGHHAIPRLILCDREREDKKRWNRKLAFFVQTKFIL